ncbi:MAG TPA: phosphoribosylformylglycinamidine synthase subunit PurQ [Candidatus Binataceae bacterium]|nr:phosphoribosylformylglycinamidine synthase subunit PurQ [Candidatus Binataceae bacterium]
MTVKKMRWGVIRFPGSLDDLDAIYGLRDVMGQDVQPLWHKDESLHGAECVVLPGGFSYGDHLRCGAIARFSPIMKSVAKFAADGGLVIGICNGFQILTEAHLLPGALTRNRTLSFICERVHLRVENAKTPFTCTTRPGDILAMPIKHGEGCYVAPEKELLQMEERGQIILRYVDTNGDATDAANPNGSMRSIAGVANDSFNVFGLMPHPEHALEGELFGADGRKIFESIIAFQSVPEHRGQLRVGTK